MKIFIDARSPYSLEKIYSITVIERILRQLYELGLRNRVTVILQPNVRLARILRKDFHLRYPLEYEEIHSTEPLLHLLDTGPEPDRSLMLLEGNGVYDERVVKRLLSSTDSLFIRAEAGQDGPLALFVQADDRKYLNTGEVRVRNLVEQGIRRGWLKAFSIYDMDAYIPELRQTASPTLLKVDHNTNIRELENALYEKTFKGTIDFIATYLYRIPVRELVRLLAPTRVTPNHITALSVLCSFGAIPLFALGWPGTGMVVAWMFIIADSLDGKLARLTIRFNKAADKVDHFTSPVCEASYYLAWGWFFSGGAFFSALPGKAGFLLFCSFGLDRIITSVFGLKFGRSLLDYTAWDARFHRIAARRNVNLFIMTLGLLLQIPIAALYAVTAWMGITMLWHIYRYVLHTCHQTALQGKQNIHRQW